MINPGKPDYKNTPSSPQRAAFGYGPAEKSAKPVVSIVTPFYNGTSIFYETAESVFRQSLQQWEWLIINDGSTTPDALAILDEYSRKDPRIRVVNHPRNLGLSAARNTGFREARTEYIYQLDSDDLIEPTTLEKLFWHLETNPNIAFASGFTVGFGALEYLWQNGFHNGPLFLTENPVTATNLVRKSVHQKAGGYDEEIRGGLEDWDFWMKCASLGHWGSTVPEYFDWYRRRDSGREHWDNVLQKEKFEKFNARLKQKYPKLWEGAFPEIAPRPTRYYFAPPTVLPVENRLEKSKQRLLYILPHLEMGGADKFNLDLIRQLQKTGRWEVTVVSTRAAQDAWLHEFEALTPDVFMLHRFISPADFPRFLKYLITSRQIDAVCMSNSQLGYQLLPYLRSEFPALPFVDYLHMEEESVGGGYPRCSLLYQSQLAKTVTSSGHLKNWITERGGKPGRVEVCHTNIDTGFWSRKNFDAAEVSRKWNLEPGRPVILYAGRVCAQKQPGVFANVIVNLARKNPGFTALVAGDGPDLPALREIIQKEKISQVRFLGAVSNEAIRELLSVTDIFFLPSQWEGISLAIYEAMSMEAVPVGANVGGQKELVSPDCGILVNPGPNEAADYFNSLQKLLRSPELRKRMAAASRARVEKHFEISRLAQRMTSIFESARAEAAADGGNNVAGKEIALLHASEVMELSRSVLYSEHLLMQLQRQPALNKHTVDWQAAVKAGQVLAQKGQKEAAIQVLEEGAKAAAGSGSAEIELAARLGISQVLLPLDRRAAEASLAGALPIAEQLKHLSRFQDIIKSVGRLAEMLRNSPQSKPDSSAPVVSVVIPCYKQAGFLPEAVQSVLDQTFKDFEIIIVNDGSPDNTSDVARDLISKNPGKKIRLVEKANGGLSSARNAGFRAALGKYVLPLDADDKIKPTLLEKLTAILDAQPKVGFAYTHIQHFGDINTEWPLPDFNPVTLVSKENIVICCSLCRKTMWEQVGGYNENMREGYEDWDFWIGAVEKGWTGCCHHEPLFMYRKHGHTMLAEADKKRERLIATIVTNHPKLYNEKTRHDAQMLLDRHAASIAAKAVPATASSAQTDISASVDHSRARLRVTYLISSILGVTGGNQTLLRQAEEMRRRGHEVNIVTYSDEPDWFKFETRVIQVPPGKPMAAFVPPSDVVVSTYFTNTHELKSVSAPVKVYYAQGDQFVFGDTDMADSPENRALRQLSLASYQIPGVRFVPNSNNLANAVLRASHRKHDALLPVCTDQTIFRPLQRSLPGSRLRLLIVGPDARGTEMEPLLFKGIQDIHDALQILAKKNPHFTAVRMSATGPDIFARFPCEFYIAPSDEMKSVLYGTSHILIYASHYDSCPRPPQEAMAAGCAVVCTATSGAMEYCRDGENSLLVPVKSPAAIAAAVEKLMVENTLREKIVEGGFATARAHPREREWNEWESILFRFVDESKKGAVSVPAASKPAKSPAPIKLPACALAGHTAEARSLLQKGNFKAAWESTLKAIRQRPFNPEAFLLLGEIAYAAGDSVAARQCAQHARDIAPEWKPARQFLKANLRGNAKHDWLTLPESVSNAGPAQPRLTVCLIARNEEKFLGNCLSSVKGLASQIVLVDTGSTDRTIEIAKEHGAEVHHFKWCDDFSAARNAALEHATGDWVLFLDADEELMADHRETILNEIKSQAAIGYRLPIIDVGREKEGCSLVPRLFRNAPGLFFVGRVHEQVFSSLEVRRGEWGLENCIGKTSLLHHGYAGEVVASRDKIARNLRLLELAIEELPGEPNLIMNLGLELVRSGQVAEGLGKYREALELLSSLPEKQVSPELRESLLTQYATQLLKTGRHAEIVGVLTGQLAQRGGLTASQHFILGLAHMELKDPAGAVTQMRQCLAKRKDPVFSQINPEILGAGPSHCLALSLAALQENKEAEEAFREAISADASARTPKFDFARFQAQQGRPIEALKLLNELVELDSKDPQVWLFGGQIALSQPDFISFALDWTSEAFNNLPENGAVVSLRAEALLLGQQADASLPLWTKCHGSLSARQFAALTICELVSGEGRQHFPEGEERAVSQEFLKWYRQLIRFNARTVLEQINARLDELSRLLPSAAATLNTAVKQARELAAA
jgi:glycosyltransferase involved in cell wall biosynthesis/Tfp pilus assembly protein PilF